MYCYNQYGTSKIDIKSHVLRVVHLLGIMRMQVRADAYAYTDDVLYGDMYG